MAEPRLAPALAPGAAALLAICANPDADHTTRLARLSEAGWAELVDLAGDQRAVPLVQRAIEQAGPGTPVPPALRHAARHWHLMYAREMLVQRETLARAVAVLRAAGLQPIALKGVRLAYRDYPTPSLRPLRDFDLLLPANKAERAQELLLSSGGFELLDGAPYGIAYGHQLPEIIDPLSGTVIEIHHRLNARGWREEPLLLARLHARAEPLTISEGIEVRVPCAIDNVLHLVEHATLHHLFDNGPLILADLHYASRSVDWPTVIAEATELGLARAIRLVAAVARRHGAGWPPPALIEGPQPDAAQLLLADDALLRPDLERKRLALLRRFELRTGARPGLRAGIAAMLSPGAESLAQVAGTAADDPRRWLGYPRWLVQRLGAYRAARGQGVAADHTSRQVALHRWLHGA